MFAKISSFISILQLVALSCAAQQQVLKKGDAGPFTSEFAQLANETLELFHVPGVSIAVVDGDKVWAEGYGMAILPSAPVTPSTLFYCGSTTKAFTAAALSLLIDNSSSYQNIQWTTPISELIRDDFVLENDYATTHTTIEDALSHRSGLPRHDMSYGARKTVKDSVRDIRFLKLTAEPRTKFQYCSLMFFVASHVVETLTGVWLGDFLQERVWEPLGMKSTYFSTPAAQAAPEVLAQGYVYHQETSSYQPVPFMDLTIISGAGSVISNVLDYSKWLQALLSKPGPISKAGYKSLFTPRSIVIEEEGTSPGIGPTNYALGWFTGTYYGYEYFSHSGGMDAYGAQLIFFPKLNYGLVALGNTAGTSNAVEERLLWHLIYEKIGVEEEERFDWNKKNLNAFKAREDAFQNAAKIFYPSIPTPPIAASLPLSNYTGTYHNAGYHNITVSLAEDKLFVNRSEATWKVGIVLEHVSGDFFLAEVVAPGFAFRSRVPAEFKIGADGVSRDFGILVEVEMGADERVWFDRV